MENLLLWFVLLVIIIACVICGIWLLCNVNSYLGSSAKGSNQTRHPLFAGEHQRPLSSCKDPRQQQHVHWRSGEQPQPQPQPLPPPPSHDQQQRRNGYPLPPYYIEPPIDYTPPPAAEPPRKHTVCTQTYQTYAKKNTVTIEQQKNSILRPHHHTPLQAPQNHRAHNPRGYQEHHPHEPPERLSGTSLAHDSRNFQQTVRREGAGHNPTRAQAFVVSRIAHVTPYAVISKAEIQ